MDMMLVILEYIVFIIKLVSVIVLIVGLFWYLKDLLVGIIKKKAPGWILIREVKNKLGAVVLLGLEILIIADIIETVVEPTFSEILLLAAIVAIRTVISHFLNKEIEGMDDEKGKRKKKEYRDL